MSRNAVWLRVAALLLAATAAAARTRAAVDGRAGSGGQTPAARPSGIVMGQAVDGTTGRPLSGVVVTVAFGQGVALPGELMPAEAVAAGPGGALRASLQVLTDAQGRFAFSGLAKGHYALSARKGGWIGGAYGQQQPDGGWAPLDLAGDAPAAGIVLRLWHTATLGGTVVDEAGEPVIGVTVNALRRTWLSGHQVLAYSLSAQTDDRGMYRIAGLAPGEYVAAIRQTSLTVPTALSEAYAQVMAAGGSTATVFLRDLSRSGAPMPGRPGLRIGDAELQASAAGSIIPPAAPGADGRVLIYPTVFYPATRELSGATPIRLSPGSDESGVDFQLAPVPAVRVSGIVTGPTGPAATTGVRLVPAFTDSLQADIGFESAATVTDARGRFTFLGVPPGTYSVRILKAPLASSPPSAPSSAPPLIPPEPTLWAARTIAVGERDVTGVDLTLQPGLHVSGRVEFDGTARPPSAAQLERLIVYLEPADGRVTASTLPHGQFDAAGRFSTIGLVPGKYFIRLPFSVGGWTLKSAAAEGRDFADTPLDLTDHDVEGVVITLTDRMTGLAGFVRSPLGRPAASASVLAFPVESSRWTDFGATARRFRFARAGPDGRYQIVGLPPGEYFLAALTDDPGEGWQNPATLAALARTAVRIRLADAEKRTQVLQTETIR